MKTFQEYLEAMRRTDLGQFGLSKSDIDDLEDMILRSKDKNPDILLEKVANYLMGWIKNPDAAEDMADDFIGDILGKVWGQK